MTPKEVSYLNIGSGSLLTEDSKPFALEVRKTAIARYRISTGKQYREGDSFGNQDKHCKDYCKKYNLRLVKVFQEVTTGKKSAEETSVEAIEYGKKHKINYFIIFDIDRFTRDGYGTYEKIKEKIEKSGMELRDAKSIIQPSNMVYTNELVDLSKYSWNIESPSEYAEAILATNAKIEGKKILQKTIVREIELEQMGYQVRGPNYGFINKKVKIEHGKACIQIPHPKEGDCVLEMYKYRNEGILNDSQIANELNLKGHRKKNGKELTNREIQRIIENPMYAGIKKTKWTGNKAIRTPYKGLVDITTWNKANVGRVKIIEIDRDEIRLEYSNGEQTQINEPILKRKKNYNPEYPFSKALICPHCHGNLTGSSSTGRGGIKYHYYHCRGKGGIKHLTYSIKKEETHKNIIETFKIIKVNKDALKINEEISREIFEEENKNLQENIKTYKEQVHELNKKEKEILDNIDKVINFPTILEAKNKELEEIKILKEKIENKSENKPSKTNLQRFLHYSKEVLTHLDKFALQKDNPALINLAFDIVCNGKVEYENFSSHTANFSKIYATQSQQKNLQNGEISGNILWLPKIGETHTKPREYNQIRNFVKRLIKIINKYENILEKVNFGSL